MRPRWPVFKFCRVRVLTTQSSFSITQELAWNADLQAPSQAHRIRICILTASSGNSCASLRGSGLHALLFQISAELSWAQFLLCHLLLSPASPLLRLAACHSASLLCWLFSPAAMSGWVSLLSTHGSAPQMGTHPGVWAWIPVRGPSMSHCVPGWHTHKCVPSVPRLGHACTGVGMPVLVFLLHSVCSLTATGPTPFSRIL